ncbi:MAG: CaiB/BaiF CoA transferase family protein [Acidimicrobiia bacterium]
MTAPPGSDSPGLLDGFVVIDLSRVLAGPYAGQVMAEMGADVIKVELPGGDPSRAIGPHLDGRSAYFSSLNTGKRGVCLDLRTEAGRRALEALVARGDVVLHNFRPSIARDLGLDPPTLLGRHPDLVVVTVASYAGDSDRAEEPAFDLTIQAETGIMAVTGEPGRPPVRAGVAASDLVTGLWAAFGAVAALLARARGAGGRHVEVPMVDATLPLLSYLATTALVTGRDPGKVGSGHHSVRPYGAFPVADGWIVIAVLADKFWPPLCDALDLGGAKADARFATNAGRLRFSAEVEAAVVDGLRNLTLDEAAGRLTRAGVPHAPVLGLLDALSTPYVRHRGLVADLAVPEGSYRVVQGPLRTPGAQPRPAPALGEHTEEVLREVLGSDSPLLQEILAASPAGAPHRPDATKPE